MFSVLSVSLLSQTVGSAIFDGSGSSRSIISQVWLVGPVCGWIAGVHILAFSRFQRTLGVFDYVWLVLISLQSFRKFLLGGAAESVVSFLSWGAWFGSYIWVSSNPGNKGWMTRVMFGLLVVIGFVLSVGVLVEFGFGVTIFKQTTIGTDVVRRYGFSQSVAVGGLQTGCGLVGCMYLSSISRSWLARWGIAIVTWVLWFGLFLSTARGPIIITIVAVGVVSVFGTSINNRGVQLQVRILGIGIMAVILMLLWQGFSGDGFIEYLTAALRSSDTANVLRVDRIEETVNTICSQWEVVMFGVGAGETVALPTFRGGESMTSESSILKLWLEGGIFCLITFFAIVTSKIKQAIRSLQRAMACTSTQLHRQQFNVVCAITLVLMLIVEFMFHDMLTTWIMSGIFWCALGNLRGAQQELCLQVGDEVGGIRTN